MCVRQGAAGSRGVTQNNEVVLYLVGVYLPTRDHTELYLETLACMQELMESVNSSAPIVILGDMNTVLPLSDYLHEKWYFDKRYTNHSTLLHDFISNNRMCVADLMFEQRVPYTYKHGNKSSHIDHVIIPDYLCDNMTKCDILCDDLDNASDHMAVSFSMNIAISALHEDDEIPPGSNKVSRQFPRPNWQDSEFVQKYMSSVADAMDKLPLLSMGDTPSESDQQQVNTQYDSICHLFHQSVESNIPTQRPNRKTVKWRNKDCTATRNRNRLYHHIWKCCGRPSTGCVYECYKATRKSYRRSCRQAVQNKTQNTLQILEKLYQDRKCHQGPYSRKVLRAYAYRNSLLNPWLVFQKSSIFSSVTRTGATLRILKHGVR